MSRAKIRPTDVVLPLEPYVDPELPSNEPDETLDWCFEDDELRRELRAVHRGRNGVIALIGSGIACAILLVVTFA